MASISDINGLSSLNALNSLLEPVSSKDAGTGNFGEFLADAMSGVQQTDSADKAVNMQLLSGEIDDLHTAVLAGEKAELTLRLTTQIRSKITDAYSEIMRMQV